MTTVENVPDNLASDMLKFLHKVGAQNAVKVVSYEESFEEVGYCPTCYDTWEVLHINYLTDAQEIETWSQYTTLAQFINNLVS